MTFYERFKFLCDEKGVSPAQAARENGVTQQAASHWKQRGTTPKSETLWKFVSYFDTNIDFLLGKQGAPVRSIQIYPEKKRVPYRENSFESSYQEFLAIDNYLDEMGYKISVEFKPDGVKQWTLYDKRTEKGFLVPQGKIAKLTNGITAFARYQISELIVELSRAETTPQSAQMPKGDVETAQQSSAEPQEGAELAPQPSAEVEEGKDTGPAPEGSEGTQKPSEDKK